MVFHPGATVITAAWMIAAVAFALTAALAVPLGRLAWAWGFVDRPQPRKHHRMPTPMLGGVALIAGVLAPPLLVGLPALPYAGIAAGAVLLLVVGLVDDRVGVGVAGKLVAQAAAAALVLAAGVGGPWLAALGTPLGLALGALWLIAVTNAFNLLDNVDGLAAGMAAVTGLGSLALTSAPLGRALAAALVGACLGFLLHNWSPARLFMGDAGSLPLGLVAATLGLEIGAAGAAGQGPLHPLTWLLPLLLLAVPLADTATVCVSRLRHGRNPLTSPGTDHLSHRLLRLGLSVRGAVSVLVLAALITSALAVFLAMPAAATEAGLP